ncbi:MinD/ParA family protein [Legionella londiniensis]|uniref:Flagellar biosynthesis MinD n=1 Tax=Legionella londiniensis TaxID=45068 RepID=A0A0W0VNE7_9GAMM|nr:MinD/ParA family protein [Legionella londiniensis]KTD21696.1 flagellar biosynthesis MinD [Legionella londiniensis]STX93469.1 flagellar biosynthesis MinD [Legionella londiniensis]
MSKSDEPVKKTKAIQNLLQKKPIKVIAITSGKGGVGKSAVSINLAYELAKRKKSVLLLDADLELPGLDIMLGVYSKYNLQHLIKGECDINEMLIKAPGGFHLIAGSPDVEYMSSLNSFAYTGIINAFNELNGEWDYLIIDTAPGVSENVLSFIRSVQEIILVVSDEPTSLTSTYALIKIMKNRHHWMKFHVLVNMARGIQEGQNVFNKLYYITEQFLEVHLDYVGMIPFEEEFHRAIKKQKTLIQAFPESEAAIAIRQLATTVEEWPVELSTSGNICFFAERYITG